MENSSKALALWWARTIFLATLTAPVGELVFESFGASRFWFFLTLFSAVFLLMFYFFLRSRSLELTLNGGIVTCSSGVIFRRSVSVKAEHILSYTKFTTPLSKKLGLCNFYICCEGANFLIFPISEQTADTLEAMISDTCPTTAQKEL